MDKIAIVILNFNGDEDTIECLKSIEKLSYLKQELLVIVVDNGSAKKFSIIRQLADQFSKGEFKIIRNEENLGFSGGNNVGIKYALENGTDYILILNNDTVVQGSLLKELLSVAKSDSNIGVVVPKIYFAKGFEYHKERYKSEELGKVLWYSGGKIDWKNVLGSHRGVDEVDHGQYNDIQETDYATGCCMFVKAEVFKKIGFLNDNYFLYYEDNDFSQRAKKTGFKIIYAPKAIIWHKNAGSAGGSGSELQDYYITRNRLLFGFKYAPLRSRIALIKESISMILSGRQWQKKGVLDFYLGRFGKGSFIK